MSAYLKIERAVMSRRNLLMKLFEENASRLDYMIDVLEVGEEEEEAERNKKEERTNFEEDNFEEKEIEIGEDLMI